MENRLLKVPISLVMLHPGPGRAVGAGEALVGDHNQTQLSNPIPRRAGEPWCFSSPEGETWSEELAAAGRPVLILETHRWFRVQV